MVVLDTQKGQLILGCLLHRITGGEIIRMEIMDQGLGLKAEELFEDRDGGFKVLQRLQVLHVPDMLADEGILVPGDTEGILQFRPAGQDRRRRIGELYGIRRISPGSPKGLDQMNGLIFFIRYERGKPDAVIVAGIDLPVVEKKPVGKMAQSPPGLFVILGDRLL